MFKTERIQNVTEISNYPNTNQNNVQFKFQHQTAIYTQTPAPVLYFIDYSHTRLKF